MILTLQTHGHQALEDVRRFLSGNEAVDFVLRDRLSAYSFIVETLVKFRYRALPRRDKGSTSRSSPSRAPDAAMTTRWSSPGTAT